MLIESHFLPCVHYFCILSEHKEAVIDQHSWFEKQSYRNRAHLLGSSKIETIIIPVVGGKKKTLMKDIQIDGGQNALVKAWRAVQSNYGKAPFFEYFAEEFHSIFSKNTTFLLDLNHELLTICLKLLQIDTSISFSNTYHKENRNDKTDWRNLLHPKHEEAVQKIYKTQPYNQLFGREFVPNLSIIDTLMCEGPASSTIIRQSIVDNEQFN